MFQGKKRVIRSSAYNNYLIVEGLGAVVPIDVTLYVVDHSENVSTPVTASFTPDTPPIETIFASLKMEEYFEGVHVTWKNEQELEIGITLFAEDSLGIMREGHTEFSIARNGSYTFRGYDTIPCRFAVSISDKWNNISERLEDVLTPLYAKLLDRTKHAQENLPIDNLTTFSGATQMSKMFDGLIPGDGNFYHTQEGISTIAMPFYFTVNLGVNAVLSRFVMYPRFNSNWEYILHNVKEFEIWGTDIYKRQMPEDYWEQTWKSDWKYLGKFVCSKPSGNDTPGVTTADREYARKGFEFSIPTEVGVVRYLRFAINSTWGNTNAISIQEIQFYGNDKY
jgi:hypothetical protein